jgi:Family of unknown function (DUF5681)
VTTEKQRANLQPFKPGKSGNPGGRPKKRPITDRYHEGLEAPLEENIRLALGLPEGSTNGDAVAKAQIRAAIKGKTYAARELREAIEGKSTQRLEIVGEEGGAVKVDIAESLARIREFYGLANPGPAAPAEKPDGALPVPAQVDRGQEPLKDRGKK